MTRPTGLLANLWLVSDCRWLVIYDNVESSNLLMPYWPKSSHGKVIITTRNHSLAVEPADSGLEIPSWSDEAGMEFLLFLLKNNIGKDLAAEKNSAYELSKILSGHALAISHMAGLITRRSWSIAAFMNIYLKDPSRAHKNELDAIWDFSFHNLEDDHVDSFTILGIVSFLMPDNIPQEIFELDSESDLLEELRFCTDEFLYCLLCVFGRLH